MSKTAAADPADRIRSRVLAAIRNEPWLIMPEKLELIDQIVVDRLQHGRLPEEASGLLVVEAKGGEEDGPLYRIMEPPQGGKAIAVLPIHGVLSQRIGLFERISGGTSSDEIAAAARELKTDSSVGAAVLDVDSPGGQVAGTEAAAEAIKELAAAKPTIAVANSLMASGAYWLGSAASRIVTPKSSILGSVGIAITHVDRSKQYESRGLRPTIITAGRYKAVGSDTGPLDDEAIAVIRERINSLYETFIEAVAANRKLPIAQVREKIADGRVFTGRQAVALKVADEIGTLEKVIARLTGEVSSASSQGVTLMPPEIITTAAEPAPPATAATPPVNAPPATAATPPVNAPAPAVVAAPPVDVEKIKAEATAEAQKQERERAQSIRDLVATAGLEASLADDFVAKGCTIEAARERLFTVLCERNKAAGVGAPPNAGPPIEPEKKLEQEARAAFDAQKDVYAKTGVTFDAFLKTFKAEKAAA